MRMLQHLQIRIELALAHQRRAETLDRHIGEHVQAIEDDAVFLTEYTLVVGFERCLRRGQERALRIIDEIERKPASVAERIQFAQGPDRGIEHTLAALALDIVLQITGHRRDDLDPLMREEFSRVSLSRLFENREIATVDHMHAALSRRAHEAA